MNQKTIRQYRDLVKEIEELKNRISEVQKLSSVQVVKDSVSGSNPHFPYQKNIFTIEGLEQINSRRKKILQKRIWRCERLKLEIEEFIDTIEDSKTRRVFQLRYIYGCGWEKISRMLGGWDESYARKIHDRWWLKNT